MVDTNSHDARPDPECRAPSTVEDGTVRLRNAMGFVTPAPVTRAEAG